MGAATSQKGRVAPNVVPPRAAGTTHHANVPIASQPSSSRDEDGVRLRVARHDAERAAHAAGATRTRIEGSGTTSATVNMRVLRS